jgi:methylated-DNA-[protein]-cysteine S-methyltransferase
MTNHLSSSAVQTPLGPFTVLAADDGAVLASGFTTDSTALLALVHPTLGRDLRPEARADLGAATRAVTAYFDGDVTALDTVEVRQRTGGEFQATAWAVLRGVAPGQPISYTAFAARSGRPAAVRAAATACARNAAALFVPCHRVLRGDGSLGGYRWGVPLKRWLLDHEHSHEGSNNETP